MPTPARPIKWALRNGNAVIVTVSGRSFDHAPPVHRIREAHGCDHLFMPATPATRNPRPVTYRNQRPCAPPPSLPRRPLDSLSRRNRQMEHPRRKLPARARSQSRRVLFLLASGPIHRLRRLRESATRQHLLRRRALLGRLPGFHGGRRGRRRARGEGDLGPAPREGGAVASGHRPAWIFLVRRLLTAKTPFFEGWKSLDFRGFSRPKRAFSMGYAGFSLTEISSALLPVPAAAPN